MITTDSITDKFKRSWDITKQTFHVMKADKEILLFPLLSGIFSILLLLIFSFPIILMIIKDSAALNTVPILGYIMLFAFYFIVIFFATFFNVGTVHIAKTRFEGGDATFKDGLNTAMKHIKHIIAWSVLAATVGLILNVLQSKTRQKGGIAGMLSSILISIVGFAWAIVSIFVVPAMVIKGQGPIEALKSSALTVKKTWGESLIRYYGLGLVQTLFTILGIFLFLIPGVILIFSGFFFISLFFLGLFLLWLTLTMVVFSSANTIFNTALFLYADKGEVTKYYTKETLSSAFRSTK